MTLTSSTLWLRVSSIVSFLFAAGHTLGGFADWSPIGETDVLRSMRAFHFDVQGVSRSYMDFYQGFGWGGTVSLLLQAVLLWQLSRRAKDHPQLVRPLVVSFAVASAASTVVTWMYIFAVPGIFSTVLTACLVMAELGRD